MALADLTPTAVLQAIEEYDRLGQDAFLRMYGFRRALRYVLVHDGRRYDSKAIAGAAHGRLDGHGPLRPRDFSGGAQHAAERLRGLGFKVVDTAGQADGELGQLLLRIGKLRVSRVDGRPALHQPVVLLWAVGRAARGAARMLPWRETERTLGELLRHHGLPGSRPRPDYPIAALHRAGLWELTGYEEAVPSAHGDAVVRRWFEAQQPAGGLDAAAYDLLGRSAPAREAVVDALLARFFDGLDPAPLLRATGLDDAPPGLPGTGSEIPPGAAGAVSVAAEYDRLHRAAQRQQERNQGRRRPGSAAPVRSPEARQAVLLRSGGHCENPGCTGQPDDVTADGHPILEVDHVRDLATGGPDLPENMVALCPNCHAVKTRGRTSEELRAALLTVARERHARLRRQPSA
ncbi:HNH endonuclease [Streptomyces sp. NPDC002067]